MPLLPQQDASTPVDLLYLTPRRTRMLMALLVSPQPGFQEALVYFGRVGVVERDGHGCAVLTVPRGKELALRIKSYRPPHTRLMPEPLIEQRSR